MLENVWVVGVVWCGVAWQPWVCTLLEGGGMKIRGLRKGAIVSEL
jgi:hypothetical protein